MVWVISFFNYVVNKSAPKEPYSLIQQKPIDLSEQPKQGNNIHFQPSVLDLSGTLLS